MADQAAVVDALYAARRNGSQPSGLDQVQCELEEALAVQLRILDRFKAEGERLGGWKVGLTSGNARDRMGKDFRPFGYVLQSRIFPSGATVPVAKIMNCSVEPELCLIIGSSLRGDAVDVAEAKAAVRAVAPAFEINERRVRPDTGHALLLADGLAQWGIVVGPEAPVRAPAQIRVWLGAGAAGYYRLVLSSRGPPAWHVPSRFFRSWRSVVAV